ncbi:MAG: glycosyltransferase family 4 protein [Pseudomonadota bacterium]
MPESGPDLRIAVLSDNGIERDARILKEIAWAEDHYATVHSFSLRQRGEAPVAERLLDHARFRASHKAMSKSQAQAAMAGIPSLRRGQPPEITLKRAQLVLVLLLVLSIFLALGATFARLPVWPAATLGIATLACAVLVFWVRARHRSLARMTEISPKTGAPVPILDAWSSQYKQSHALTQLVEEAIRTDGPYDILHCHELVALEAGAAIKRRHGGKLIWDTHEIYEDMAEPDPGLAAVARKTIREAAPDVDGVITVNDSIVGYYRDTHPDLPEATVVMNATPRSEMPRDDGRLREASCFGAETRILLFQGGLTIHRGLQALVRSAADYPQGWGLVVLGNGVLKDELRGLADRVNADTGEERVRFLPAVPNAELAAWTAGADLGVIPYENVALNHWYCSPNKLWEYPAAGVPFIAPRHHFIRRLVDEYGTGFLFASDFEAADIARTVSKIDEAALARARDAIPRFLDEMSWETFTPRIGDLYERVSLPQRADPT